MSPETGSAIIGIIQIVFGFAMLPTVFDRSAQVPRSSSGLTAGGLWIIAAVYALMALPAAAWATVWCAACWSAVFVLRPVRLNRAKLLRDAGYKRRAPLTGSDA